MSVTSPFARKCRILLREKRIPCEEANHAERGVDIGQKNPLGKIPALELDDGTIVYDSVVICEYLDALVPEPRFIPEAARARMEVRRWEALADGIADAVVLGMLEGRRAVERRDPGYVEKQHQKVRAGFAFIEQHLAHHGTLFGEGFTLADAAVISAFDYTGLRAPALIASGFPTLRDYLKRVTERSSVAETAPPLA